MDPVVLYSLSQLIDLDKIFKITIDAEKLTVDVTILNVTIKNIKYSSLKSIKNDQVKVETLLSDFFIQKGIMWVDFSREPIDECIRSILDLIKNLKKERDALLKTGKDEDRAIAGMLNSWSNSCDWARREMRLAKKHEEMSIGDPNGRLYAQNEIPRILGTFRARSIQIVYSLIELLPIENEIRRKAEMHYYESKNLLIRTYYIDSKLISDLEWALAMN